MTENTISLKSPPEAVPLMTYQIAKIPTLFSRTTPRNSLKHWHSLQKAAEAQNNVLVNKTRYPFRRPSAEDHAYGVGGVHPAICTFEDEQKLTFQ